jgi:hypothetical protein
MAQPGIVELATNNSGLVGVAITFFGIVAQMFFWMGMKAQTLKQLENMKDSHDDLENRVAYIEGKLGL